MFPNDIAGLWWMERSHLQAHLTRFTTCKVQFAAFPHRFRSVIDTCHRSKANVVPANVAGASDSHLWNITLSSIFEKDVLLQRAPGTQWEQQRSDCSWYLFARMLSKVCSGGYSRCRFTEPEGLTSHALFFFPLLWLDRSDVGTSPLQLKTVPFTEPHWPLSDRFLTRRVCNLKVPDTVSTLRLSYECPRKARKVAPSSCGHLLRYVCERRPLQLLNCLSRCFCSSSDI